MYTELFPLITRWELINNKWKNVRFPLNKGSYRDIPADAVLHESLIYRLKNIPSYEPGNNHGGSLPPCLKNKGVIPEFKPIAESKLSAGLGHVVYEFPEPAEVPENKRSCTVM